MPYLTYETAKGRLALRDLVAKTPISKTQASKVSQTIEDNSPQDAAMTETKSSPNANEKLVQGYHGLQTSWNTPSLHIRRTLDQFFFHDLKDVNKGTPDDDVDDQTIGRYQKLEFNAENPNILMVDQLWLWILDDGTYLCYIFLCLTNGGRNNDHELPPKLEARSEPPTMPRRP